jgi:hypothetical protein
LKNPNEDKLDAKEGGIAAEIARRRGISAYPSQIRQTKTPVWISPDRR